MIFMLFFFSHRALLIGVGRDRIGLKVTEIAQTDKQTDTHSALCFRILTLLLLYFIILFVANDVVIHYARNATNSLSLFCFFYINKKSWKLLFKDE
jgi:hypothetical protein